MKKFALVLLSLLILTSNNTAASEKEVFTTLSLKYDWIDSAATNFSAQKIIATWNFEQLSGGLEITHKKLYEYFQLKPFLILGKGKLKLPIGYSIDNNYKYFNTGLQHGNIVGGLMVFTDNRNYFSIDGKNNSYFDSFVKIGLPLTDNFFSGLDLNFYHWWTVNHEWLMVGPFIGYRLNQNTSFVIRISRDWNFVNNIRSINNSLRLEVNFNF